MMTITIPDCVDVVKHEDTLEFKDSVNTPQGLKDENFENGTWYDGDWHTGDWHEGNPLESLNPQQQDN